MTQANNALENLSVQATFDHAAKTYTEKQNMLLGGFHVTVTQVLDYRKDAYSNISGIRGEPVSFRDYKAVTDVWKKDELAFVARAYKVRAQKTLR